MIFKRGQAIFVVVVSVKDKVQCSFSNELSNLIIVEQNQNELLSLHSSNKWRERNQENTWWVEVRKRKQDTRSRDYEGPLSLFPDSISINSGRGYSPGAVDDTTHLRSAVRQVSKPGILSLERKIGLSLAVLPDYACLSCSTFCIYF